MSDETINEPASSFLIHADNGDIVASTNFPLYRRIFAGHCLSDFPEASLPDEGFQSIAAARPLF